MSTSSPTDLVFTLETPPTTEPGRWATILGGKGAGLARMHQLGLPVPPGFTIPTYVCNLVLAEGWPSDLDEAIAAGLVGLESLLDRRLGDADRPLLVSVRSGAPISMPGMMDTVLNAGMTPEAAAALGHQSGDVRFGWDTYRRFVESYASIVTGAPAPLLESSQAEAIGERDLDTIDPSELPTVLARWRELLGSAGHPIPDEPSVQVVEAVKAVFQSWHSDRADTYRRREGISSELGTAATVQAMVFGNQSDTSGTGVAFTRDPSTGERGLIGDFLVRAQGEDVVAGTHDTQPISELAQRWPDIGVELQRMADTLEYDLIDLVDIEFTVEDGRLWLLQARVGKRSPRAALRLAVEMAEDAEFPLERVGAVERVAHLLENPPTGVSEPVADDAEILAEGLAASPGRAVGRICVDPDVAVTEAEQHDIILIRSETSPADIHGMAAARGLVTSLGGLVSHAAVVARAWGVPAVVGASAISVDVDGAAIEIGAHSIPAGTEVTVDGDRGQLLLGAHPGSGAELPEVAILRVWLADHGGLEATAVESAEEGPTARRATTLSDEACRRALALKGMATAAGVAEFALVEESAAEAVLGRLEEAGHAQSVAGERFMMTPDGTAAVEAGYVAEAVSATPVIEPHLDRFHELNHRFKEVVTSWQMREVDGESVMNDHSDPDYDAGVLEALSTEIHEGIVVIIDAVSVHIERLGVYKQRLETAVQAIAGGDTQMVANPLRDSYHTVWFELHEELIRLSGRNRADEAAAGRA